MARVQPEGRDPPGRGARGPRREASQREVDACNDAVVSPAQQQQVSTLLRTVETQVIPRLMLLHRIANTSAPRAAAGAVQLGPVQVAEFTELILGDAGHAASYVDGLLLQGAPLEAIYLELLAPAARRLGEMWTADLCDFASVTLGLGRLQRVLRELSAEVRLPGQEGQPAHRALLMAVPGEQHTFGLSMVMEFFRQSGWLVWHEPPDTDQRLLALVRDHWFDVVGISVGSERHVEITRTLVRDVRRHSHNRAVRLLVGGALMTVHEGLAEAVGADAGAADARQAMLLAERLMASR